MQLLRDNAVFEMPPEPTWFTGRELIGRFLQTRVLSEPGRFQVIPTAANGQPALAAYQNRVICAHANAPGHLPLAAHTRQGAFLQR
jgi:hypothetical protein